MLEIAQSNRLPRRGIGFTSAAKVFPCQYGLPGCWLRGGLCYGGREPSRPVDLAGKDLSSSVRPDAGRADQSVGGGLTGRPCLLGLRITRAPLRRAGLVDPSVAASSLSWRPPPQPDRGLVIGRSLSRYQPLNLPNIVYGTGVTRSSCGGQNKWICLDLSGYIDCFFMRCPTYSSEIDPSVL
jgi:hypothetical protein